MYVDEAHIIAPAGVLGTYGEDPWRPAYGSRVRLKLFESNEGHGYQSTRDAIKYFTGKVPVLGVCMGLECPVDVFRGDIACVHNNLQQYNMLTDRTAMLARLCTASYFKYVTMAEEYSNPSTVI